MSDTEKKVARPGDSISLAAFYNAVLSSRGFGVAPHHIPICQGLEDERIEKLMFIGPPGTGKALALDTRIPTPIGWTTIDALQVGDEVIHPSGDAVKVLAKRDCPETHLWCLTFDDGQTVSAHPDHEWVISFEQADNIWFILDTKEIAHIVHCGDIVYVPTPNPLNRKRITKVTLVSPASSACIQVDAEDGLFVVENGIVTHNSTLLGVVYPAFRIGKDPSKTVLGVSAGEKLIGTFINAAGQLIQYSEVYKRLFPDVRPDFNTGWSTERGLFVTGRPIGDQDASYFAAGLKSKALTGVHAREIILDDPHDETNSATPDGRSDVVKTYYSTIIGRGDPRGVRMVLAGRRWAHDDLYGTLARSGNWVVLSIPAERPGSHLLYYDVLVPNNLKCVFSETLEPDKVQDKGSRYVRYKAYYGIDPTGQGFYWPQSTSKRQEAEEVKRGSPKVFAVTYNGDPNSAEGGIFKKEDFRAYAAPDGLSLGLQSSDVRAFISAAKGRIVGAWDTAFGQSGSDSKTANIVGMLVPCRHWHNGEDVSTHGRVDFHYDVYLVDRTLQNIKTDKLIMAVRQQHRKWGANPEIVEEKASGISIIQTLKGSEIPIKPQKVQEGKIARATQGVGGGPMSVQGWARMGRIHYPANAPWAEEFLDNVVSFTSDSSPRSDDFDALVHLVTYAIVFSNKTALMPSEEALESGGVLGPRLGIDPRMQALNAIGNLGLQVGTSVLHAAANPWSGMCGAPCWSYGISNGREYCKLHERNVSALDGCDKWSTTAPADFAHVGDNIHD